MSTYIIYKRETRWMAALAIGMLLAVLVCCVQARVQMNLSKKLLRLHVVAHSDEAVDQAIKLKVRDAVLACGVGRVPTPEEMRKVQKAAEDCLRMHGFGEAVQVEYRRMYFETRTYDTFALPAGYYRALRVTIGEGRGANWWCVVYPALCTDLAEGEQELTETEIALIKKDGKKFLVRFKVLEMLSAISHKISEEK